MYLKLTLGKKERSCTTAEGATVVSNEKNEKESISNISQSAI